MVIRKTMKNAEIYSIASALIEAFNQANEDDLHFPVKVNFYFQKNMKALTDLAKDIEQNRVEIIKKYGEVGEDENVTVSDDKIEAATAELNDLFELEQEVPVNALELDWFDGIDMSPKQVAAITFMIKDEE